MDPLIKVIEIAVEETLNPSSKDMRLLKEKLLSLLSNTNINPINYIINNYDKCITTSNIMKNKRKILFIISIFQIIIL